VRGLQEYLLLLRNSVRVWFTSSFKGKSKKKAFGKVFGYLAIIGVAVMWTVFSARAFGFLRDLILPENAAMEGAMLEAGGILLQTMLVTVAQLLSLATLMFLFLTGMRVIFEYLYDSPDVHFLLATPLKVENIFAAKFTECLALIFISISFMTLAPMIGLGITFKAGFAYYLVMVISFLAGFVLFGSLSALFLLLIMRYVPGQRLKKVLMSLTLVMALVIVFITQVFSSGMMNITEEELVNVIYGLSDLGLNKASFLPHVWMAKSSIAALPSSTINLWANLLPLLLVSSLVFWLTVKVSARLYLAGFAAGTEVDVQKKKKAVKAEPKKEVKTASPFGAMLRKEYVYLKREPMMWYQLAVGLIVMGFYAVNMTRNAPPPGEVGMTMDTGIMSLSLFMIIFFAGITGPNTAGLSLSREGQNWRFLQSLPIEPKTIYWSKFIFGAAPALIEGLIGVLLFYFLPGMPMFPLYISLPVMVVALMGLLALDVWSDVYFPNFNIKMGSSKSTEGTGKILLINLLTMPLIALIGATYTFPIWYKHIGFLAGLGDTTAKIIGLTVFGLETLGLFIICSAFSIKRLKLLLSGAVDAKGA
jgi:hypothetical protein